MLLTRSTPLSLLAQQAYGPSVRIASTADGLSVVSMPGALPVPGAPVVRRTPAHDPVGALRGSCDVVARMREALVRAARGSVVLHAPGSLPACVYCDDTGRGAPAAGGGRYACEWCGGAAGRRPLDEARREAVRS